MKKKEKKSKGAEHQARVAAKRDKKAAQKDKKGKSKGAEETDADDVDLETVLAEYRANQAQFLKVTEIPCEPPSPRSSATLIGSPSNSRELLLFGGEYYNGALATFFNDLFVYIIDKDEWRRVTSPNSPLPRSGHAWTRSNAGEIYLFGGEFSSPKQGTFYHYNDFWKLDPSTREWARIENKKGPPARSGHRMTHFRHFILLFGGFQDTSQQTKYLQDLWIYDTHRFSWSNPAPSQKPDPRSSFSFHPHEAGAVIYGGYSRVKTNVIAGKQSKGGHGFRSVFKPLVHQDTWFLRITQSDPSKSDDGPPVVRWERRKRPTNHPNPPRAGATQAYHKGRGIVFGGVHDVEESEEGIDSEFFNDLFAWNIERNRYFLLTLRRPRNASRKHFEEQNVKRGRGRTDEEELLRNLEALETKGSIEAVSDLPVIHQSIEKDDSPKKPPKILLQTMPHPRFNAQLAVQDDVLYIFGGTFENRDREVTFDEMWAVDLSKMDFVQQIYQRDLGNWQGSDESSSDEDSDEEDDSVDDEFDAETSTAIVTPAADFDDLHESQKAAKPVVPGINEADESESYIPDAKPEPRPFESLRDFFARTSTTWQDILLESLQGQESRSGQSIKELRRVSFDMAEIKWWDCREDIQRLEEEQEEAGISGVISIADRGADGPGPARRR